MRNASSKPPFLEALLTTLVIVVLLVFTTWHVARCPVGPSEEELARKVEFLTAELQAVKGRLDRSVAREARTAFALRAKAWFAYAAVA